MKIALALFTGMAGRSATLHGHVFDDKSNDTKLTDRNGPMYTTLQYLSSRVGQTVTATATTTPLPLDPPLISILHDLFEHCIREIQQTTAFKESIHELELLLLNKARDGRRHAAFKSSIPLWEEDDIPTPFAHAIVKWLEDRGISATIATSQMIKVKW